MPTEKIVDIRLLGDVELQRKLQRLPIVLQRKVVRESLRRGGKPVLEEAKRLVPADTGALKASIKLRATERGGRKKRRGEFGVYVQTGTREELGISADAKYYYPAAVELGTDKMPARSYLRAAVDNKRAESIAIIAQEVGQRIEREAAKA